MTGYTKCEETVFYVYQL